MTSATDQFLMFAAVFGLAYFIHRVKERFLPSPPSEDSGYAPNSSRIPLPAAIGAIAVVAVLVFGTANVGAITGF